MIYGAVYHTTQYLIYLYICLSNIRRLYILGLQNSDKQDECLHMDKCPHNERMFGGKNPYIKQS